MRSEKKEKKHILFVKFVFGKVTWENQWSIAQLWKSITHRQCTIIDKKQKHEKRTNSGTDRNGAKDYLFLD
jgi:hypothetical protein